MAAAEQAAAASICRCDGDAGYAELRLALLAATVDGLLRPSAAVGLTAAGRCRRDRRLWPPRLCRQSGFRRLAGLGLACSVARWRFAPELVAPVVGWRQRSSPRSRGVGSGRASARSLLIARDRCVAGGPGVRRGTAVSSRRGCGAWRVGQLTGWRDAVGIGVAVDQRTAKLSGCRDR